MQRYLLFQRREMPLYPTNETVAQVFARLSAYRDLMDGPQVTLARYSVLHQHFACNNCACKTLVVSFGIYVVQRC